MQGVRVWVGVEDGGGSEGSSGVDSHDTQATLRLTPQTHSHTVNHTALHIA